MVVARILAKFLPFWFGCCLEFKCFFPHHSSRVIGTKALA